jgi:protein-S-isoprenylcysteine O-methyltransferase Ste14
MWSGALLFGISLGWFLYTYGVTFGRTAAGPVVIHDLAWNAALFTAFALHHSVLARRPVRAAVARMVPSGLERTTYVVIASLGLMLVLAWWRAIPGAVWRIDGPGGWILHAGQVGGVWLTLRSAAVIDVLDLAGVRGRDLGAEARPAGGQPGVEFKTSGPYGWVRHPIYTGWFLIVFAVPVMTMTRLEFALISSLYILVAIPLEERTLRASSGEAYARYAARVRWRLMPGVY